MDDDLTEASCTVPAYEKRDPHNGALDEAHETSCEYGFNGQCVVREHRHDK